MTRDDGDEAIRTEAELEAARVAAALLRTTAHRAERVAAGARHWRCSCGWPAPRARGASHNAVAHHVSLWR
jgi:hypothetical protein